MGAPLHMNMSPSGVASQQVQDSPASVVWSASVVVVDVTVVMQQSGITKSLLPSPSIHLHCPSICVAVPGHVWQVQVSSAAFVVASVVVVDVTVVMQQSGITKSRLLPTGSTHLHCPSIRAVVQGHLGQVQPSSASGVGLGDWLDGLGAGTQHSFTVSLSSPVSAHCVMLPEMVSSSQQSHAGVTSAVVANVSVVTVVVVVVQHHGRGVTGMPPSCRRGTSPVLSLVGMPPLCFTGVY